MTMIRLPFFVILAAGLLTGCLDFRATDRLAEVVFRAGGGKSTAEFSYQDNGQLDEVEMRNSNGDLSSRYTYTYDGSQVTEVEVDPGAGEEIKYEITWEGGLPVKMERKTDIYTETTTVEYEGGDINRPSKITMEQENSEGEVEARTEIKITYDDSGRVEKSETTQTYFFGGEDSSFEYSTEYKWDEDGLLDEVVDEGVSGNENETRFKFDSDRRLEEVDLPSGQEYEMKYDDQGRLEEIDRNEWGDIEFEYDDSGSVRDLTLPPMGIPSGELFDLRGQVFGTPDLRQLFHLLMGSGGSGSGGSGTPTPVEGDRGEPVDVGVTEPAPDTGGNEDTGGGGT
jgi:YD repeat-containing protein